MSALNCRQFRMFEQFIILGNLIQLATFGHLGVGTVQLSCESSILWSLLGIDHGSLEPILSGDGDHLISGLRNAQLQQ